MADDDYEARMRERAARRAAKSGGDSSISTPSASTPAASEAPADDYEARMRERALRRINSDKKMDSPSTTEETPRSSRRAPVEEEETPRSSRRAPVEEEETPRSSRRAPVEEEAPRSSRRAPVEEEEIPRSSRRAPVEEEETPRSSRRAPVEEEETPRSSRRAPVEEEEKQDDEEEKEEPKVEEPKAEEDDSYKKPRASTRGMAGNSKATPSPSPSPSATTTAPSSTRGSASTSSTSRFGNNSSAPTTNGSTSRFNSSAGAPSSSSTSFEKTRPISVMTPSDRKEPPKNRFSVAIEQPSASPPPSGEIPKKKTVTLASGNQESEDLVKRIVEGDEDVAWVLFNCDPNVQIYAQGVGEVEELKKKLDDTMVLYGYIRVPVGAEGRTKFVYIRWVGSKIKPIQRAKALDNEKVVKGFIRIFHIEVHSSDKDELTSSKVNDKLARAGGANYDKTQNAGSKAETGASFNSYKERSRDFFAEKEREGNMKGVVYEKGPMTRTTPVNLSGRAMTIGAASANKNIVDLKTKK